MRSLDFWINDMFLFEEYFNWMNNFLMCYMYGIRIRSLNEYFYYLFVKDFLLKIKNERLENC